MNKLMSLVMAGLISSSVMAQTPSTDGTPSHVQLMKQRTNLKQIQKAFENYSVQEAAQGRLNKKNNHPYGWKQFRRWEYWWEPRTYPSGNFPEPGLEWKEMQQFNATSVSTSATSNWIELGPKTWSDISGHWNPGIGRINVIVPSPGDPNTIYIGAPAGGLWKTTNGGSTWTALTDNIPSMGVSAIAIHPSNPNTILIGTGDRDANDTYGVGVLKSTDGGATWTQTSLTWAVSTGHTSARMVVNPSSPNTVLAGTTDGLYRSSDFGNTWTKVLAGDIDDLELKPGDPNYVYALVSKTLYRSTNGGLSFASTGQSSTRRAQIAVTPAAPSNVYFFSKSGLFLSTDNGASFRRKGSAPTEGSQDWYDLAIAVSPTDASRIHVGEIETYTSSNGGKNWTKLSNWYYPNASLPQYVHSDVHELVYINNTLYCGSDGLITRSTDGINFTDLTSGLGIRQFYNLGLSKTDANKFGGGSQDNGTYMYTPGRGWHGWLGADGFETVIAPDNATTYGTSQNGTFYKSTAGGTNTVSISQPGGGAWNTPFVMHPTNPNTLYVGNSTGVRKTTNGMSSWATIGNLFPAAINDIAIGISNPSYLYASVKERIWVTKNDGGTWTEITAGLPGYYITDIAIDPQNTDRVMVTCSGYNAGKKVYLSTNAGTTWTNISYNLPNLPANASVVHQGAGIYVGMDVGIYYLSDGNTAWEGFMTSLPNVPVTELEIQQSSGKIRAATFGRGMWESSLAAPASVQTSGTEALATNQTFSEVKTYPNPAGNVLHVEFNSPSKQNVEVRVCDEMTGRTLMMNEVMATEGSNEHTLNLQHFPQGTYIVRIITSASSESRRIQVKR
ncbi:MAG: T9SS type A sorting domain-containing protein [Bacteroidota bacterium]